MFGLTLLPIVFVLLAATYARSRWRAAVEEHSKSRLRSGLSAAEAARRLLEVAGVKGVQVVERDSSYTNRFDPRTKTLLLSPSLYRSNTAAATGLALHEAGHAIQWAEKDAAYPARLAAIQAARFFPGALLCLVIPAMFRLIPLRLVFPVIGVGWLLLFIWNMATLPAESGASKRARVYAKKAGLIQNASEEEALEDTMAAAAWVRMGDFLHPLRNFIHHLLPLQKRS